MVMFEVRDTGIGMTPEQLDKLFQPFVRPISMTRKYGGTGLGLTITRHFCQMLGGEIHVSSQHQVGSTFTALLPLHTPATLNTHTDGQGVHRLIDIE